MIRNSIQTRKGILSTGSMVKIAMLASLGTVLMLLDFPLPIFPSFLKFDLSDVPAVIGAFAMGPAAGVAIELLKNIIKVIVGTNTGFVGEIANFFVGAAYVLPVAIAYQKRPDRQGVIWGSILAILNGAFVAGILNYLVFIPLYGKVLGFPIDAFVSMGAKINAAIVDLRTLVMFAIVPFNLLKGGAVAVSGWFLFRAMQPLFKKE